MSRNEPGGLDVVFSEKLQETANSNGTGEETLASSALRLPYPGIRGTGVPLEISLVESSPPYEPSQPATASISTEKQQSAPDIVSGFIIHWKTTSTFLSHGNDDEDG